MQGPGGARFLMSEVLLYLHRERDFFIDNLLVRIHLIIEMILADRSCAMGACIPFSRKPPVLRV